MSPTPHSTSAPRHAGQRRPRAGWFAFMLFAFACGLAQTAAAGDRQWLGPDGQPLPFTTDTEALEFLAEAEVVGRKQLDDGINKPLKLTLGRDGVTAHAIFRTVDHMVYDRSAPRHRRELRDSYVYEVAAYELGRMLGVDNVPPAVLRTLDGRPGSLQLWIENATTEKRRIENGEKPDSPAYWHRQKQSMAVFDSLIYNFDRNPGNMLFDAAGKLWYVDHTRTFKSLPALPWMSGVVTCDERFWQALKGLDEAVVRARLSPYLDPLQISTLLKRRQRLVRKIELLIAERGAEAVLYRGDEPAGVQIAGLRTAR